MRRFWKQGWAGRNVLGFGSIALAVPLGWYFLSFLLQYNALPPLFGPTGSGVDAALTMIPSTATTVLVVLVGWAVQRRIRGPHGRFLAFLAIELAGWAATLVSTLYWLSLVPDSIPDLGVVQDLTTLSASLGVVALYLLLALTTANRPRVAVAQSAKATKSTAPATKTFPAADAGRT